MKKVLIALVALLVVAVAALLVAPSFIDWNRYKDRIAQEVAQATGRQLDIGGDMKLSLLPRPALMAESVRMASLPGAVDADMLRVAVMEVRVDPAALLSGEVRVESVRLVEPLVVLERLPDGRATWDFEADSWDVRRDGAAASGSPAAPQGAAADAPSGKGSPARTNDGLALRLDKLTIEDGTLVYRDTEKGVEERISDVNVEVSAESLRGPYRLEGELTARSVPLFLKAGVGEIAADRAAPLTAEVALQDVPSNLRFAGLLTSPNEGRSVRGDLVVTMSDLRAAAAALGQPLPQGFALPVELQSELAVSMESLSLDGLEMVAGDTEATGGVSVAYGTESVKADVALDFGTVHVDRWLNPPTTQPVKQGEAGTVPGAPRAQTRQGGDGTTASDGGFVLPDGVTATLDLTADAVTYREGIIRQVVANAALAGGELTINEFSAQLPGNSSVSGFGLLTTPEGTPTAEMALEARSDNLRNVLNWLGVDVSAVPGGRLNRFQARATVAGTMAEVQVRQLDATIDTTALRGAATIRPGKRPAIGATFKVGSLNLDAYVPRDSSMTPGKGEKGAGNAAGRQEPAAGGAATAPPPAPLAGLEVLNTFDANVRADVETLTWRDVPMHDVHLEFSLLRGTMTFKDTGVGQVFGARAAVAGGLSGFGGQPKFHDFSYSVKVPDAGRVARAFAVDLPVPAESLGVVDLDGRLDGTLKNLTVATDSRLGGARIAANGTIADVLGAPSTDLAVDVTHPDTMRFLGLVAPAYQPRGPFGAFSLRGRLTAKAGTIAMADMALDTGDGPVEGDVAVNLLASPRPEVTATLRADRLIVDRYLPLERQAALPRRRAGAVERAPAERLIPAAYIPGSRMARPGRERTALLHRVQAVVGPWSTRPIDLSGLLAADVDASLTAGRLTWQDITFENADLAAVLADGALTVNRMTGGLFGGIFTGTARLSADPAPTVSASVQADAVQVAPALEALAGKGGADGLANLVLRVETQGGSSLAMAENLTGSGSLTVDRMNVGVGPAGAGTGASQALLGPVAALNQVASLGAGRDSLAQLVANYAIENGIVRFETLKLDSALYNARFEGVVNLPRWTVDVNGQAKLAPNLLTGLLGTKLKLPEVVPIAVVGSLEDPRVRVQTGRAPQDAAPEAEDPIGQTAPALPRTPEDAAKQLLEQFLMPQSQRNSSDGTDTTGTQPEDNQPAPSAQQSAEPAPPRPEDILRRLLQEGLPKR